MAKTGASSSNDTTIVDPYTTQKCWIEILEKESHRMSESKIRRIQAIIDGFKTQPEIYRKP